MRRLTTPTHQAGLRFFGRKGRVNWLLILPEVWIVLLLGWSFLIWSISVGVEVPAAGAILVCAALIADIMVRNVAWSSLRTFSLICHFRLERRKGQLFFLTDGYKTPATWRLTSLFGLLNEREETWGPEKLWRASKTAHRVTRTVYYFVVFSAIVGTLVWGYAHLGFD